MQSQCNYCVMDNSASEIVFTETGCNFCDAARIAVEEVKKDSLRPIMMELLLNSSKRTYDCLIGLSGGVDSSYALHRAVGLGFRPLCFTMDNGWNDPVADENILKLVETLKVPLFRYTIDLNRFKELQAAFLKSGVKNVEIPTDHVLMAISYELASKYGIKTILSGGNVATESIMPPSWGHNARDLVHIKAIYKRFTNKTLRGLPMCGIWKWNYYRWIQKIKTIYLLDYYEYNREEAVKVLNEAYNYQYPGEKHEENVFTRWFQNYYLFEKFGIDKRKAHYSSLIVSGQMTRAEALQKLETSPVYPELGLEKRVLAYPRHEHSDFPQDKWYDRFALLIRTLHAGT